MAKRTWLALGCGAVLLLGACGGQPVATVELGDGTTFSVEVADEPAEQTQGLSGRAELPAGTGMLFTYQAAANRAYWMKDMLIPIDLAWIHDGRIREVQTLQPCPADTACEQYPSPGPVDAVLEVPAGALTSTPPGTAVHASGVPAA